VAAPFVHDIDPVLARIGPVYLWWYGLSYALGFLNLLLSVRKARHALQLSSREVYSLALSVIVGVLAGGRLVEVLFDEWEFYREHVWLVPAMWLGGMATHGLLAGAAAGAWLFCRRSGHSIRVVADALVVPGALLMGVGRIGNFIDGQIVGAATDMPWGVQFPGRTDSRHPVVLYDGLKNLLLVPYLAHVRRTSTVPGAAAARFVFWYPFTRIFIDLFRDYPTHRLALGTGQTLNLVMAAIGLILLVRSRMRRLGRLRGGVERGRDVDERPVGYRRLVFASVLAFSLTIPSNWTQDVPVHYRDRHPGMQRSILYPAIDTAPGGKRSVRRDAVRGQGLAVAFGL
jgi:phosphatidylglycerol:prolipoprotein diacylglycerol transferase